MSSLTTAGSMSLSMGERSVSVEESATHLSLGIAGGGAGGNRPQQQQQQQGRRRRTVQLFGEVLELQDDDGHGGARRREPATAPAPASRKKRGHGGISSNVAAAASSRQQNKKARKFHDTDGGGGDRRSPASDGGEGGGGRKKLRLTAAQAAMLEDSFRAHNILSHGEKQELARRVGLTARQVEVWFQNRRARTKLKQTEIDCELLRRWCDRLADENARLRRDLAELRASAAVCAACCDKQAAVAGAEMATAS